MKQVLQPVLSVLTQLHTIGMNHLNLHPENILFTTDGQLRLSDVCVPPQRPPKEKDSDDEDGEGTYESREEEEQVYESDDSEDEDNRQRKRRDRATSGAMKVFQYLAPEVLKKFEQPLFDGKGSRDFGKKLSSS